MGGQLRVAVTLEQCWHEVPGGTARSALDAVSAMVRHTDLELIGVSARHRHPPPPEWQPEIAVRMLPLGRLALYESWHAMRWPKVERATGPVDVIHATGMAVPPRSAPLVVTVHDLGFLHQPDHVTRHGLRFFRRAIDLTRREADLITAPSQATIDDCVANGFDPSRIRLVPWGIRIEPVERAEIERVRAARGLDRPYVLWTGTIEPRKNLPMLLEAFDRMELEGLDLVLAGPQGWNERLDRLIGPRLRHRVRALGFVAPADLRALYAGAEVFCLPSLREGFGLPVLEAMAQGTPVVTSAGTATEEVVGEAGLVVDPSDVDGLAHALERVVTDRSLADRLGALGRARAATFTWRRTAEALAAVYAEAAAR
ncbi:MAG: glycosyltransferase family 1 protein [Acidimicrobiales bacterium]|jgi:glycosyltransferase involved in cell wall biosynthesis